MMKSKFSALAKSWAARLQAIDYECLPVSDYNKEYLHRIVPVLPYYMEIYARCLNYGARSITCPLSEITVVDYGGGCGFLSILARAIGFGQVIYIDLNPLSVEAVKIIGNEAGLTPSLILEGDSSTLSAYCREHDIHPQLLISTDVIEHIYNLQPFFNDLHALNPDMRMVFTTASTPYNPVVKRRLHRFMQACETGSLEEPNYFTLRKQFLLKRYPNLTTEEIEQWAIQTRGLTYTDMHKAVEVGQLPHPIDPHNTCDPETGNWAERILPISAYAQLTAPYGYHLTLSKGFYNTNRQSHLTTFFFRLLNIMIRCTGPLGLLISPFLFLKIEPNSK
jgi:2-polyprenyl-3-methyl-5-hydroxy-6-metoxy-1,4-benzoquinol methylase